MATKKHGHCGDKLKSPTYRSWSSMKTRCDNQNDRRFADYGGRGISYAAAWSNFLVFLTDMGERPEGTTLDRKDNTRPYCKENCRWSTPALQAQNRRKPSTNKTGHEGVHATRNGRYRAMVVRNGRKISLYHGDSLEAAVAARMQFATIDAARNAQLPEV